VSCIKGNRAAEVAFIKKRGKGRAGVKERGDIKNRAEPGTAEKHTARRSLQGTTVLTGTSYRGKANCTLKKCSPEVQKAFRTPLRFRNGKCRKTRLNLSQKDRDVVEGGRVPIAKKGSEKNATFAGCKGACRTRRGGGCSTAALED